MAMADRQELVRIIIAGIFFIVLGVLVVAAVAVANSFQADTDWIELFGIVDLAWTLIAGGIFGTVVAGGLIAYNMATARSDDF